MTKNQAKLLMAGVIIARSTSYIMSKHMISGMGPFNVLSLRFILATIFLVIVFRKSVAKSDKKVIKKGAIIGFTFFLVMSAEMFGLKYTDTQTVSFLENTAIVFVPLIEAVLLRRAPKKIYVGCGLITLAGVGFLTLRGGSISLGIGEAMCILAAFLYAIAIIVTGRLSKEGNTLLIGIWQVIFMGVFATIATFIFEAPQLPAQPIEWLPLVALAVICTGFGFTLQPVAQRHISTETAGLYTGLNPLSAAILGRVFLGESLGINGMIGAGLILSGLLLSTIKGHSAETEK